MPETPDLEVEHQPNTVSIDGVHLTLEQMEQVARTGTPVRLSADAIPNIQSGLDVVAHYVDTGVPGYGINTGVGSLSDQAISTDLIHDLQRNLLRSHASGSGSVLPEETIRAAILLRANSLALGYSGVRTAVIKSLIGMLNAGITPVVPSQGSLGASGDLAPLAHIALPLIGEGEVIFSGERMSSAAAFDQAGLKVLTLEAKEALALMNGAQIIAALATLALLDAERLLETAISIAALSMSAIGALQSPFDPRIHAIRPHPGQIRTARRIRELLENSTSANVRLTERVQDPYSIRCVPQVLGGVLEALHPLRQSLEREINSATDNPLVFHEDFAIISGGNFHGHPLALKIDAVKIAIASLGTITERRISLLVDGGDYSLPRFLVSEPGINSGYMIAHYLTAGLVAENRILAHPASVDSIPTSANIEDYNSMGTISARHLREIVNNVEKIVAVEALCAAQACDLTDHRPSGPLGEVYSRIRSVAPFLERDDRVMSNDIEELTVLVHAGELIAG